MPTVDGWSSATEVLHKVLQKRASFGSASTSKVCLVPEHVRLNNVVAAGHGIQKSIPCLAPVTIHLSKSD
jgi:hypothetical protein